MEGVDRAETDKIEGSAEREYRKKQFGKVDRKERDRIWIEQKVGRRGVQKAYISASNRKRSELFSIVEPQLRKEERRGSK